jgi:ribosomal protein L44E
MLALSKLPKIFLKLTYPEVLQREIKVNGLGKGYFCKYRMCSNSLILFTRQRILYCTKPASLISWNRTSYWSSRKFLNLTIGTTSNMYMRHIMYYCKYCSFFLAKEISVYRDENTHNSSHTRKYFEIHTKGCFEYRDVKFVSKVNKHIAWRFEYRDEENPHTCCQVIKSKSRGVPFQITRVIGYMRSWINGCTHAMNLRYTFSTAGSGFGQKPGTYHFRTTILPQVI